MLDDVMSGEEEGERGRVDWKAGQDQRTGDAEDKGMYSTMEED